MRGMSLKMGKKKKLEDVMVIMICGAVVLADFMQGFGSKILDFQDFKINRFKF